MMRGIAGHLLAKPNGYEGEVGVAYDYILGANGVFVAATNPSGTIRATIKIAEAEVRGLVPVKEEFTLLHGKIPYSLFELGTSMFYTRPIKEHFVAITHENLHYHIEYPAQKGTEGGVEYERVDGTVIDIHSHGVTGAGFSGTDHADEQGFKVSLVIGRVDRTPEYRCRLCLYGYFKELNFEEVFEGCIPYQEHSSTESKKLGGAASSSAVAGRVGFWLSRLPGFFRRQLT